MELGEKVRTTEKMPRPHVYQVAHRRLCLDNLERHVSLPSNANIQSPPLSRLYLKVCFGDRGDWA